MIKSEIYDDIIQQLKNGDFCELCKSIIINGSCNTQFYQCEGHYCDDILYRIQNNDPSIRKYVRKEKLNKIIYEIRNINNR